MITKEDLKKLIKEVTANMLVERDGDERARISVGPLGSAGSYRSRSSLAGGSDDTRGTLIPRSSQVDVDLDVDEPDYFEATPLDDRKREQELAQEFGGTVHAREQDPRKRASDARKARRKTTVDSFEYDKYVDAYKKEHGKIPTVAQLEKYMAGPRMPAPVSKGDIYQLQKELNKAKDSGAITVATWRKARRALQGSPGKNRRLDQIHGAGSADAFNADQARAISGISDWKSPEYRMWAKAAKMSRLTGLEEAYEVVPGSGEEGVSGISVPTQSFVSDEEYERQELEDQAALAADKARRARALKQLMSAKAKERAGEGASVGHPEDDLVQHADYESSGEDPEEKGGFEPTNLYSMFHPPGTPGAYPLQTLEEIIREEVMAHPAITSWGDKRLKQLAKEKKAARDRRAYEDRVARAEEEPGFQWALEADDEGWGPGSLEEIIREETEAVLAEINPEQDAPGLKGYSEREANREASCKAWKAQGKSLPDWCDEYI